MSTKTNRERNGAAQAALLSCAIGLLTLALVNLGTDISETFKDSVHALGKLWMPGAQGIGPYSGKETLALWTWLATWVIFHRLWRGKELNNQTVLVIFLLGIALATTLLWPPVFNGIAHAMKGG